MDRFLPPFEPVEHGECEECMSTIYDDDPTEIIDGKLMCGDCITAFEASYEFEMEEEVHETL
jgi:hypothetical protein